MMLQHEGEAASCNQHHRAHRPMEGFTVVVAVCCFVSVILIAFRHFRSQHVLSHIPLHHFTDRPDDHKHYISATRNLHYDGYRRYSKVGQAYRVRTPAGGERLILPPRYLEEVKALPQHTASLPAEMSHLLLMPYTGVPQRTDAGTHVVRVDMTRQLGKLINAMNEECHLAFERVLPKRAQWSSVKIYHVLAQVVAQISARVLVGTELCRDEKWLRISITFSTHAFGAARELRARTRHPWLMRWYAIFSPAVREIAVQRKKATALLRPICEARSKQPRARDQAPRDALQWLLESHGGAEEGIEEVVKSQLRLTMAAIHNTTMAVTNDVFDLIAHPEHVDGLRREIEDVLKQEGGWTKQALTSMRKLDSFMKESARMNPTTMLTVKRKVLQDVWLRDGFFIPKGTHIAFASDGVNRDPDVYADPNAFVALRFAQRQSDGSLSASRDDSPLQYVTATPSYLNWGGGKSACPGRFFASNEIKLMIAYMLQHYEFAWQDDQARPQSMVNDWNIFPDREKLILVRARSS